MKRLTQNEFETIPIGTRLQLGYDSIINKDYQGMWVEVVEHFMNPPSYHTHKIRVCDKNNILYTMGYLSFLDDIIDIEIPAKIDSKNWEDLLIGG